jgi:lysophospholipase L1-like esterase
MRIGRASAWATLVLAAAAGAIYVYVGPLPPWPTEDRKPVGVRQPLFPDAQPRTVAFAAIDGEQAEPVRLASRKGDQIGGEAASRTPVAVAQAQTVPDAGQPGGAETPPPAQSPQPPQSPQPSEADDDGGVTPTLEGRMKGPLGKRGLVILQIGDSHTSADFLTGELRKRLQARYGRGAPGYITAGHPHIGVRTSSLKVTASAGWTYKSLQKTDAVPAEFWLSGYNAIAAAPGETMSFVSDRPQLFDMIEIEVVRQLNGGAIDVRLDGVVETSYDLASSKLEPVVIRLVPTRAATEKVREISITTTGHGPVMIASVAIYNRQTGLTYNSIGYPGAQMSFVNKFSNKLLANDLIRINPQIVVLSFGTNEASNESLDLTLYGKSYERVVDKIKAALPGVAIVVISPPDFSELPAACKKDKAAQATCGRAPADATASLGTNGATGASECVWRTPARLNQIREVQRDVAKREGLIYWNWASIMPSECGAHRWFTASPALMAKDHVHFTVEGYKRSAEQFLNTLIPVIEKVRVGENAVPNN